MLETPEGRQSTRGVAVERLAASERGTELTGRTPSGTVKAVVPGFADEQQTRRYLGAVRRIDRVVIHFDNGVASCRAIGQRSRLPFTAPIRMAVALGLAQLGVQTTMTGLEV